MIMVTQDYDEPGTEALAQLECPFLLEPWLPETLLYNLPICLLLICNTVFLIWIMGVSKHKNTITAFLKSSIFALVLCPTLVSQK